MCPCDNENIKGLYKVFGLKYDGMMIRRPKIAIIIDDVSGDSYMASSNNFFY